jgi:hypothetical protein
VHYLARAGTPFAVIADLARKTASDLIVLGTHGHADFHCPARQHRRARDRRAHCPVLMVREPKARMAKVGLSRAFHQSPKTPRAWHDETLASRVRKILSPSWVSPKGKMFSGLCFLIYGNMCCGVLKNELVLRLKPGARENC